MKKQKELITLDDYWEDVAASLEETVTGSDEFVYMAGATAMLCIISDAYCKDRANIKEVLIELAKQQRKRHR